MNSPFTFEAEQFDYGAPGEVLETLNPEQESWELGAPDAFEYPGYEQEAGGTTPAPGPALAGVALTRAVNTNRILARRVGWGCVVGGTARPIPEVLAFLGLAAGASEEDVARAVARWQQTNMRQRSDGQLGPSVWSRMLRATPPVITLPAFKRAAWDVYHGGSKLGLLEKTAPYQSFTHGGAGGAFLQLGFRVTDMAAVRRAGFVHATGTPRAGEPNFSWIQRIMTNRQLTGAGLIRRHGRYIDPQDPSIRDAHPYYWNVPGEGAAGLRIGCFINRQPTRDSADPGCDAGIARADALPYCYDLIFQDYPRRPLNDAPTPGGADPGRRVYWNAELALVGILPPRTGSTTVRNVVLNTVYWGFDLVVAGGARGVRLNALRPGRAGGSNEFRQALNDAIRAGNFANHCFAGGGFSRQARCA